MSKSFLIKNSNAKKAALWAAFLILTPALSPAVWARSAESYGYVSGQSVSPESFIRYVPGDFISFMRSNPSWSWAWYQSQLGSASSGLQQLAGHSGYVGGDIKPDNVDLALSGNNSVELGLVDLDDGGLGSFVGDLFHTLVYNQIWPVRISQELAFAEYSRGLLGQAIGDVRTLQEIYQENLELHPPKSPQKKYKKMKEEESEFLSRLKLLKIKNTPAAVQALYESSKKDLENEVAKYGKALRIGVRLKESGGSAHVPRFTYLVENSQGLLVLEFKLQTTSAVAALGMEQASHSERLNSLLSLYRPAGDWGAIRGVLEVAGETFIVREKIDPNFDGGEIPESASYEKIYLDYVRHMFWWLGHKHALQSPAYQSQWREKALGIYPELMNLVERHIQLSQSYYQNNSSNPE